MDLEVLRKWLKDNGKSRAWLAEKLNVSKHTIDGWFAGRPITQAALPTLEAVVFSLPPVDIPANFAQFKLVADEAARRNISVEEMWKKVVARGMKEMQDGKIQ